MDIGDICIIVGIIFAVLDFFIPYENPRYSRYHGALLNIAVILIGAGVLLEGTKVGNSS